MVASCGTVGGGKVGGGGGIVGGGGGIVGGGLKTKLSSVVTKSIRQKILTVV